MSASELHETIFVARQPIFDKNEKPWGYELLFRPGKDSLTANVTDDVLATSSVIADGVSLAAHGLPQNRKRLLINFTAELIEAEIPWALPPETCIIEILETARPTPELIENLKELKKSGYVIAVDDFMGEAEMEPFLELADIAKIDILGLGNSRSKVEKALELPRKHGCKLLAEKVETKQVFLVLKEMGFDLFQGYFFSKPEVIPGRKLSSSETSRLQLLQELGRDDFDPKKLAEILRTDPSLSFRLFRHINSAAFDLQTKVESLDRAIMLLGKRQISQWLRTAIISDLNPEPKASELAFLSVHRAKFLEMLAIEAGICNENPDKSFMTGLFSLLDSMLGIRMPEILDNLPLDMEVDNALKGKGQLFDLLKLAHSYERGYWADTDKRLKSLGLNQFKAARLYAQSRNWAQRMLGSFE